jgi:hypothetical protein
VSEKVTEFELKRARVIKNCSLARALQVEPEDRVHHTFVVGHSVFQSFLHKTVYVIFFQNGTLIGPLNRWLVEKVHIYLINYYNKHTKLKQLLMEGKYMHSTPTIKKCERK